MQKQPTSVLILGAATRYGRAWLEDQFPSAPRQAHGLVLKRPCAELDAVVWAEELRFDARCSGVRLSIGVAERRDQAPLREVVAAATRAYVRARDLGGDITLTHSVMFQAA